MTEHEHPQHLLRAFVLGQLGEDDNEKILSHLAECDQCLAESDLFWVEQLKGGTRIEIPDLGSNIAERVERSVIRRIYCADMAGQVILLGTLGLFMSWQALVRPLFRNK